MMLEPREDRAMSQAVDKFNRYSTRGTEMESIRASLGHITWFTVFHLVINRHKEPDFFYLSQVSLSLSSAQLWLSQANQ